MLVNDKCLISSSMLDCYESLKIDNSIINLHPDWVYERTRNVMIIYVCLHFDKTIFCSHKSTLFQELENYVDSVKSFQIS